MTTTPFTDLYKKLSDSKLLDIIENKNDYQPIASQTARLELESRRLSEEQTELAKQENRLAKSRKQSNDNQAQGKMNVIKHTADKTLSLLDPLVEKTPEKSIILMCVILGAISLFKIVSNFNFIFNTFTGRYDWEWDTAIVVFDVLFLPISLVLLWRKKNSGRILVIAWSALNVAVGIFGMVFLCITLAKTDSDLIGLLPMPNMSSFVFSLLFHLGIIYYLSKQSVKQLFTKPQAQDSLI